MVFSRIHSFFPLGRLLRLILLLAVTVQVSVILYNNFSGYYPLRDFQHFLFRLGMGIFISMIAGFLLAYPDLYMIRYLNKTVPWNTRPIVRILSQTAFAVFYAVVTSIVVTVTVNFLRPYTEEFAGVLITNALIYAVVNILFMAIFEAWFYMDESTREKLKTTKLELELAEEARKKLIFETKAQIEEVKVEAAQQLIEQEKRLNLNLQEEIKRSELLTRQLNESREQLQSLLSNLVGAAYRCHFDEFYTILYISDKIHEISGYPSAIFENNRIRTFASIIHPDDIDICIESIARSVKNKIPFEIEYRIIHANKKVVWVKENGIPIYGGDGKVAYLDGIIVDITARKEAELTALESDRKYKELMDFLPQPIFELDLMGNLAYGNKAGYDFFGLQPNDQGKKISVLDCFVKEDLPRITENIKNSIEGKTTDPSEYTAIKGDGSLCPVMVFGSPIVREGRMVGRRGIIIDISERKRYEMRLIKAKDELEKINTSLEQVVEKRTRELTEINTKLLQVQKENLQSQFEVLKSQINPHFMFNSLNVLSGLISKDIGKAQQFIDEFSHIYRYVLETLEQQVVPLEKELDFMRSYLFLQQIRYGNDLSYTVNLPSSLLKWVLPPLSLQVVLENAIKHNIVNESKPLKIEIYSEENTLHVRNTLQPKISAAGSTGLGLKNLVKRYGLISESVPAFQVETGYYIAKLPLIETD